MVSSLSINFKEYRELVEHIFLSEIGPVKTRWDGLLELQLGPLEYTRMDFVILFQTSGGEYLIDFLESHNALQQLHKRNEGLKMCNFYSFLPFK